MADVLHATRRDGVEIKVGQQVTTDFHPECVGRVFIVIKFTPYNCESGYMCLTHLDGAQDRELKGSSGLGLDTNWFKPHDARTKSPDH